MPAKRILFVVGDFVEDYEIMVPYQMLLMVGHLCDCVCPGKKGETMSLRRSMTSTDTRPIAKSQGIASR